MKLPSPFKIKRSLKGKKPTTVTQRKMKASTRSASRSSMDDYEDEPTMKLGTAVMVVLVLHIVAVGGVYAFNRIKAERHRNADFSSEVVSNTPTTLSALSPQASVDEILDKNIHQVEAGETLANIARSHSVSVEALEHANGLSKKSVLRIGQELRIPNETDVAPAHLEMVRTVSTRTSTPKSPSPNSGPKASEEIYTVVAGDNPVAIARKFKVSYNDLMKLNEIGDPRRLQIGQKLKIPVAR